MADASNPAVISNIYIYEAEGLADMADLESIARKAVADFLTAEAMGFCALHPELSEELIEMGYSSMEKKIDEYALCGKISIEQAYSINEQLKEEIGFRFLGYDAAGDYIGEIEHGWLNSMAWHKANYDGFVNALKDKGFELPEHLKQSYEKILCLLDRREKVISRLLEKGNEKMGEEDVKNAFRNEYAGKEDYVNDYRKMTAEVLKFKELAVYAPQQIDAETEISEAATDAFAEGLAEGRIKTIIYNEAEKIFG